MDLKEDVENQRRALRETKKEKHYQIEISDAWLHLLSKTAHRPSK